jgi:uncharacterized ferritin-like protein (DUF455 family)
MLAEPRATATAHPSALFADHSLEFWAYSALTEDTLSLRRKLPTVPATTDAPRRAAALAFDARALRPTRPAPLRVIDRAEKLPTHPEALRSPRQRAMVLHTFAHHELQALELMCWAILTWPETPAAFRRGLAQIACDESRHMDAYLNRCESLGFSWGFIGVRDWFWQRLAHCESPAHYVATMAIGFEGANLDHTERFATLFSQAGDHESAELIARVGEEELPHVRFGKLWFERFVGRFDAQTWREHLVSPLSPWIMHGPQINREDRHRAGMDDHFIAELAAYTKIRTLPSTP